MERYSVNLIIKLKKLGEFLTEFFLYILSYFDNSLFKDSDITSISIAKTNKKTG